MSERATAPTRTTDALHLYIDGEIEEPLDPEKVADMAEHTIFSALMLRTDLDTIWATTTDGECRRNVRRHLVASRREAA